MKYFAHLCTAQDDDKFDLLFEKHSLEGYGTFWWLCEHVGRRKKTANDNPEYLLNTNPHRKERGMRVEKLLKIVRSLAAFNLIEITEEPGWISVKIPKLNAYSAEWQKRLAKSSSGDTPEALKSKLPSEPPRGLGREVVDVKILDREKRKDLRQRPHADGGVAPQDQGQGTDEINDPKARAEALKIIREATGILDPKTTGGQRQDTENGKIPTATGPEVEAMGCSLQDAEFKEPLIQDVLNAWWANRNGTHDVFAIAEALDKHGVKGQDRSRLYAILGVV